jgi:hypothetical protein
VTKRPKYSRWRRLPKVYRSGEFRLPAASEELQLLSLYLPGELLDAAEAQASRTRAETVQSYCAELLRRAIEAERVREQVADVEARRGPLEGLHEIANDAAYLAEWNAQAGAREQPVPGPLEAASEIGEGLAEPALEPPESEQRTEPLLTVNVTDPASEPPGVEQRPAPSPAGGEADVAPETAGVEPRPAPFVEVSAPRDPSPATAAILRHAGQDVEDPLAFLPTLRRGEVVAAPQIAELARALRVLEAEYRDAEAIDRRLAYALHRLAFEAQVLHTDAWPGAFDVWTVDTIRAVQEAVERILSGQDIHYYPLDSPPELLR